MLHTHKSLNWQATIQKSLFDQYRRIIATIVVTLSLLATYGCGIYTFNGSSLPADLKTVEIPLFLNNSMEPNVADEITQELNVRSSAETNCESFQKRVMPPFPDR